MSDENMNLDASILTQLSEVRRLTPENLPPDFLDYITVEKPELTVGEARLLLLLVSNALYMDEKKRLACFGRCPTCRQTLPRPQPRNKG